MSERSKYINPSYKKTTAVSYTAAECLDKLDSDTNVLSYLLSKAESTLAKDQLLIDTVLSQSTPKSDTKRIAITGSPGVGKSTFLNAYCHHLAKHDKKVAIIPVDPTSRTSKGSILGDKTRMDNLIGQANVFIKPMASALALGGVAPSTGTAIALCEAAAYDYIFVETVGVGQSEYAVKDLVDLFILLIQPGSGDELQGIKRGIMEMADLLIMTKADGELEDIAKQSLKQYKNALHLLAINDKKWTTKTMLFSSISGIYTEALHEQVLKYFDYMKTSDQLEQLRISQALSLYQAGTQKVLSNFMMREERIKKLHVDLELAIKQRQLTAYQALRRLEEKL